MKTTRCTDCAAEFTDEELNGVSACPTCGTKSIPCSIAEDVDLKTNWHELRILTLWASNYSEMHLKADPGSQRVLSSIIKRLEAQYPDKTALTLFGEVKNLAKQLNTKVEIHAGGKAIVVDKPDQN